MARRSDISDEEVGGVTSALAKSDSGKSLVRAVREIAEKRGIRFSDAVAEALDTWTLAASLENVDPKALVAAMQLYRTMINDTIRMISSSVSLLSSSFMESMMKLQQSYMESAQQIVAQQLANAQPIQQETNNTQPQTSNPMQSIMQQAMQQMMMKMMMELMDKLMPGLNLSSMSTPTPSINQELQKIKIVS